MSGGRLVLLDGKKREVKRFSLSDGLATLGRDPSNDICFTLSTVAPHHATVLVRDGKPLVQSTGGRTLVNGRTVSVAALRHGDIISIADRSLRWETLEPDNAGHMPSPAPALSSPARRGRPARVPAGRHSAPAPAALRDRALQLAIEMSRRASISGATSSGGKQVAVVQLQRRNASEHIDKSPARSSPQTTSRRNTSQELNTSLPDEDKAKRKSSQRSSPKNLLQNTTKAALWIEQRKTSPRRKPAVPPPAPAARRSLPYKKSTPLRLAVLKRAQYANKPRLVKIEAPLTIDHTKQAAIMLMTGHTPKAKLSISPKNKPNKISPSYVVKKPTPVRKTPVRKGRQSGRGSKDTGQNIGVTPSRGSTYTQDRRSSKMNSTNPSVSCFITEGCRGQSLEGEKWHKRKTIGVISEPKRRADAKSKSIGPIVSSIRKTRLRLSDDSERTDPDAAQPDTEDTVTPRSAVKPSPEAVKNKHSTAKKPQSKRSIIDDLNSSDIIKQLFNSPVKRKLSQSMTEFSRRQLFDDDDDIVQARRPMRRTIAVTGGTPDSSLLEATSITPERFVSPVETPNNSPNRSSLKRLIGTPQSTSSRGGGDSPRATCARPSTKNRPQKDLSVDMRGVKLVFAKSPENDLRRVSGVRTMFQQTSPKNDLTDVRGVRRMFQKKSPENDLRNVSGVKRTLARTSPRNDLTDVRGVRRMFKQSKPAPSYHDVSGIEELYDTSGCSVDRSEVLFDMLVGRPPIKKVYSKTFIAPAKKARTRRRSLRTSVEITPDNVDEWIQQELKKRLPLSANVTKELQRLATDTVEESEIRASRTRNSSFKAYKSASDVYNASTLPIKKRSLVEAGVERKRQLPLKKRAVHSTPVKGRVEVTMNASELERVSPIAVVHLARDIELEQDGFVSRSTQTINEESTTSVQTKTRTPRKQETPKKIEIAKQTPEKSPEKPAPKRATRNKKVPESSQTNTKKRRTSLVVSKKAPVMCPKATANVPEKSQESPKKESRRTRATTVSIVVPKPSPKMKPQPAAKSPTSPKMTTRKVTIKAPESPEKSPEKPAPKRATRNKKVPESSQTNTKKRRTSLVVSKKAPVMCPKATANVPEKSQESPKKESRRTRATTVSIVVPKPSPKMKPQPAAKSPTSPKMTTRKVTIKAPESPEKSPEKPAPKRATRIKKVPESSQTNTKKRRTSLVVSKKAPVMCPKTTANVPEKSQESPKKESRRTRATTVSIVVPKPSPKMKPQPAAKSPTSPKMTTRKVTIKAPESPEKSPEKPAPKRATRNKKVPESSQTNTKKRRTSLVVSKKAPVMCPKATANVPEKSQESPKKESRRTRATTVSIVVPKPSPKMKPQPAAKSPTSPKMTTRKVTIKAPESPEKSPEKPAPIRATRNKKVPESSQTNTKKRRTSLVVSKKAPVMCPKATANVPEKSQESPKKESRRTRATTVSIVVPKPSPKMKPQPAAKSPTSPKMTTRKVTIKAPESPEKSPEKPAPKRATRNKKVPESSQTNTKKRRTSLVVSKKAPVMCPKATANVPEKSQESPKKESRRTRATTVSIVVPKPSPKMKPQPAAKSPTSPKMTTRKVTIKAPESPKQSPQSKRNARGKAGAKASTSKVEVSSPATVKKGRNAVVEPPQAKRTRKNKANESSVTETSKHTSIIKTRRGKIAQPDSEEKLPKGRGKKAQNLSVESQPQAKVEPEVQKKPTRGRKNQSQVSLETAEKQTNTRSRRGQNQTNEPEPEIKQQNSRGKKTEMRPQTVKEEKKPTRGKKAQVLEPVVETQPKGRGRKAQNQTVLEEVEVKPTRGRKALNQTVAEEPQTNRRGRKVKTQTSTQSPEENKLNARGKKVETQSSKKSEPTTGRGRKVRFLSEENEPKSQGNKVQTPPEPRGRRPNVTTDTVQSKGRKRKAPSSEAVPTKVAKPSPKKAEKKPSAKQPRDVSTDNTSSAKTRATRSKRVEKAEETKPTRGRKAEAAKEAVTGGRGKRKANEPSPVKEAAKEAVTGGRGKRKANEPSPVKVSAKKPARESKASRAPAPTRNAKGKQPEVATKAARNRRR